MIKEITLFFENLESFTIPVWAIGKFYIGEMDTCISRVACNGFLKRKIANKVVMELFKEGDAPRDSKMSWFERVHKFQDVTSIEVTYKNGSKEEFAVDYDETTTLAFPFSENGNQSTVISSLGNLYLVIHATDTVDTIFSNETINDAGRMEHRKQMLDIRNPEAYA